MNYTEKQFQEILDKSNYSVTENATGVSLLFDNKFFFLESSYCQNSDSVSYKFYVGENESEISDEHLNKMVKILKEKIQEEKNGIETVNDIKETQEFISDNFINF